jgi:hypothetical protein
MLFSSLKKVVIPNKIDTVTNPIIIAPTTTARLSCAKLLPRIFAPINVSNPNKAAKKTIFKNGLVFGNRRSVCILDIA